MGSASCSTVVGAYSEDPYGPVVNCDSNLPMDELLQCVDEQYTKMDAIHESKQIRNLKEHLKSGKHTPIDFGIEYKKVIPEKIDAFKSIKNCYLNDKNCYELQNGRKVSCSTNENNCKRSINGFDVSFDQFNKTMAIGNEISFNGFYKENDKGLIPPQSSEFGNWFTSVFNVSYPYQFLKSNKIKAKDIIIANANNKTIVFTVGAEEVKLREKDLLGVKVLTFCNITPEQLGYTMETDESYCRFNDKKQKSCMNIKAKDKLFTLCNAFNFWILESKKIKKDIAISLDKRINPTQVFIKLGDNAYKINLTEGEFKN